MLQGASSSPVTIMRSVYSNSFVATPFIFMRVYTVPPVKPSVGRAVM